MSTQETWLAEIGRAAEELGYGIRALEPDRIELMPFRENHDMTVVLRGRFLSGDVMRTFLRDLRADWLTKAMAAADEREAAKS